MSAPDGREAMEAAIWRALRHLRHPYSNPPGCVDEILKAADDYAAASVATALDDRARSSRLAAAEASAAEHYEQLAEAVRRPA